MSQTRLPQPDKLRQPASKSRLAPWQETRAKKMLLHDLSGDLPLGEIANACGLSVTYFARAFKNSTGIPPHKWLTRQRIENSVSLLLQSDASLSDIALASGFADQSHFTRVFTKEVGLSPGAWRRSNRLSLQEYATTLA